MGIGGYRGARVERLAVKQIPDSGKISAGGSEDFEITSDIDGIPIPNRIEIQRIILANIDPNTHAVISTIRRLRFYRKDTRLTEEIVYDDNWSDFTEASDDPSIDGTRWPYNHQKANGKTGDNKIVGTLGIKAGTNDSAFVLVIFFK